MDYPVTCKRCGADLREVGWTMSMFNTDAICMDCKEKETKHPKYKEACDIEHEHVKQGNYNFPGIGKPSDL